MSLCVYKKVKVWALKITLLIVHMELSRAILFLVSKSCFLSLVLGCCQQGRNCVYLLWEIAEDVGYSSGAKLA